MSQEWNCPSRRIGVECPAFVTDRFRGYTLPVVTMDCPAQDDMQSSEMISVLMVHQTRDRL